MKERMLILAIQIALVVLLTAVVSVFLYCFIKYTWYVGALVLFCLMTWVLHEPARMLYDYFNGKR